MVSEKKKKVTPLAPGYIEEKEFIEKVRAKRRRGLTRRLAVFFIFVAIAAGTMTSIATSQAAEQQQMKEEKAALKEKLARLESKEESLRDEVKNLHDLDYIGEIARRDFYMSENGEIIFTPPSDSSN